MLYWEDVMDRIYLTPQSFDTEEYEEMGADDELL